ncbi:unnamed protein product [Caenorhabditis bovis]|uniref:Uncharacterized protein n=1 Tax=Caenorhabditis bovis TaxID=2654633 RepID=A0A8S1ETJ0_9PELO|nr:unnamed protein product [Caenorhabditis bovis]
MGDGANVFNTFSFNKWADGKREEEIDKESRKRRAEQIKRLKERLRKERALREEAGNGDLDLEALIEALQKGEIINNNPAPAASNPAPVVMETQTSAKSSNKNKSIPDELSDDYIFNEINMYVRGKSEIQEMSVLDYTPPAEQEPIPKPDPISFKYNRRHNMEASRAPSMDNTSFKYNRMLDKISK